MVHGSGSHQRSGNTSRSTGGGGGNSRRGNASRSVRTSTTTTTTQTPSRRGGQGSGRTAQQRPNQGGGTHRSSPRSNTTTSRTVPVSTVPPPSTRNATTERPTNHGSGTHRSSSQRDGRSSRTTLPPAASSRRTTTTTTTTTATGNPNHGSGVHRFSRSSAYLTPSTPPSRSFWGRNNNRRQPRRSTRVTSNTTHRYYSRARNNNDDDDDRDYYDYDDEESNECCCCCLGRCFWGCLVAIFGALFIGLGRILCCGSSPSSPSAAAAAAARSTTHATSPSTVPTSPGGDAQRRHFMWFMPLGGLLSSLVLFIVLVSTSSPKNVNFGTDVHDGTILNLFAGETQRIYLPRLVRSIRVTVMKSDPTVEAAVFELGKKCPSFSGPPVTLRHDSEFDMGGGNFEYDYYNLNPGSTIDVSFNQLAGSTYFYLLKGQDALHDIQTGHNTDPAHWESIAIAKRFVKPSTHPRDDDVYYKVRGPSNDIFTLVYDNGSTQRESSIDVETDLVLTTYDLSRSTPWCDNMRWWGRDGGDSCRFSANKDDCLILEAFSSVEQIKDEPLAANNADDGSQVISLKVEAFRQWSKIWIWSAAPLVVSSLTCIVLFLVTCCRQGCCPGGSTSDNDAEDVRQPLLSQEVQESDYIEHRPPPTNPLHSSEPEETSSRLLPQPSAPLEEEVSSAVMVPAENVTVLPADPPSTENTK